MTQKWIRMTNCENIPLREGRAVKVGDLEIAVFNLGQRFLALENRCPHRGGPLADGIVSGSSVVCPLHAWKLDLQSGAVLRPADGGPCVRSFQTRVENGVVMLNLVAADPQGDCSPGRSQLNLQQDQPEPATPSA